VDHDSLYGAVNWLVLLSQHLDRQYISTEQRISAKSTTLTLVIGVEDDQHVFDRDHHGKRPYDDRQDSDYVFVDRCLDEC
jgi:hypothetical protein